MPTSKSVFELRKGTLMARSIELKGLRQNEPEIRAIENAIRTLRTIRWKRLGRAAG